MTFTMEDKAKYLLAHKTSIERTSYETGFSTEHVQALAAQVGAEKIARKTEIKAERAWLRAENGACPWCSSGYAMVEWTCRPARWFDRPIDWYAYAECSNPRCAMRTLHPMPDEYAAREYFTQRRPARPYPEYAKLSKYGQMMTLIRLIREGWDDDTLPVLRERAPSFRAEMNHAWFSWRIFYYIRAYVVKLYGILTS